MKKKEPIAEDNILLWSENLYPVQKLNNYVLEMQSFLRDKEQTQTLSVNDYKAIASEIQSWQNFLETTSRIKF